MAWATPKYGSGQYDDKKWTLFKLKGGKNGEVGHNYYRILPAQDTSKTKRWFVYHVQHFGYQGINGQSPEERNPEKLPHRPFKCIEDRDRKTDMVTTACAECDKIREQESILENLIVSMKAQTPPASEEAIKSATQPTRAWLRLHNKDKKYYMAVKDLEGNYGVLPIPYTAKKLLEAKIDILTKQENVDPLRPDQGVIFDFQRSGEGIDTDYAVDVVYDIEEIKGNDGVVRKYKVIKTSPLAEVDETRAKDIPDLTEVPRILSADQIRRLVQSGGDPLEVDAIIGIAQSRGSAEPTPRGSQPAAAAPVAAPVPVQATPVAAPAPTGLSAEEAALLANFRNSKALFSAPVVVPEVTPAPTPATAGTLTVEQFLADYKFKQ
jgi:hypothetical protein